MIDKKENTPDKTSFSPKDHFTLDELLALMAFLRSDQGCPWDKEQTHQSLRQNMLEEAYEVIDAINSQNSDRLCDELGDVLMQVIFHSQIASESGTFTFEDVITAICNKLISRHTHLFGEDHAETSEAVIDRWEKNKRLEKGHENQTQVLEDVPRILPALLRSFKVQQKAAQAGFDWSSEHGPKEKILEELSEIEAAQKAGSDDLKLSRLEQEVGDLLFAVVNYARHLGIQPELALHQATDKFIHRFAAVETLAQSQGQETASMTEEELDALWELVKESDANETR